MFQLVGCRPAPDMVPAGACWFWQAGQRRPNLADPAVAAVRLVPGRSCNPPSEHVDCFAVKHLSGRGGNVINVMTRFMINN